MRKETFNLALVCALMLTCTAESGRGQSINATISGTVTDSSSAVVPNAQVELRSATTAWKGAVTTGPDGLFRFPNLQQGAYVLHVTAKGFRDFDQTGILVNLSEAVNVPVALQVGSETQTVEVTANASPLNMENGEVKGVVAPNQLSELPLIVSGNERAASSFVIMMPGVNTGAAANPYNARVNGGLTSGMEATLDGVSAAEGAMSQSGQTAVFSDYPITPESVSEVSVETSNYQPQYGYTSSGVITLVTKSGTNQFHGMLYEYNRNTDLNARQFGSPSRSKDIENELGGNIGGPIKIPKIWNSRNKAYFFANLDRWYIRGAAVAPVLSIPSLKERAGDFSDWVDNNGNLIPIYDPATTQPNPNYNAGQPISATNEPFTRQQFMGCSGNQPNVICASDPRLAASTAAMQVFQYLPTPTFGGPLNNFVPVPYANTGGAPINYKEAYDFRIDDYAGQKDHIAMNIHYHKPILNPNAHYLPAQIAQERFILGGADVGPWALRANWDHTFTPTLLNNFNIGYMNMVGTDTCVNAKYISSLPQIGGVQDHAESPEFLFQNFNQIDCTFNDHEDHPSSMANDMLSWVRGKHALKFGADIRRIELNDFNHGNSSGTYNFADINTGLPGITSGNDVASFLLGAVNNANSEFYTVNATYMRQITVAFFAGDTWKVTPKLSLDYGIRWDRDSPSTERYDHLTFFDPLGVNSAAGNLLGTLAYAGAGYGPASFGARHPEKNWNRGFAPRLGFSYAASPKNVIRGGYGIFYTQMYYPGWAAGLSTDGFNADPTFTSSNGGITPAFLLNNGFPSDFQHPPIISSTFLNGEAAPLYRPFDANRLPYAQQWNLTIEHQFTGNFYIDAAYVGNKGTRLPSTYNPLNALNPSYLSMGQQLNDIFQPGATSLDGVPIPYAGWVSQMTGCPPTVAQALLQYPQYCGAISGIDENAGNSTYHSFQLKAEKRYGHGVWLLGSYTLSKELTSSDNPQQPANGQASYSSISPYQRARSKGLADSDTPQLLSLAWLYQLPVGKGQKWLNQGGIGDGLIGGWALNSIFRASSGTPLFFRSSTCNVPSQFDVACIPAVLKGADPWAQSLSHYNPSQPLFNVNAFEPVSNFNFYFGQGPRMSNLRGPGYTNQDIAIVKTTSIKEKVSIQIRGELFNVWNWHSFNNPGQYLSGVGSAWTTDIASPAFGMWNGSVTAPRNIQLGMKILF
jgi:hypothetical protein